MTEDDILVFVGKSIRSVWALEVLVCLKRDRSRTWRAADLERELRSSAVAIRDALASLQAAQLIDEPSSGSYRYEPRSPELDRIAELIERTYATTPMTLIKALFADPNEKLRLFADAFKLKE